jgi:hypothetical protein
MLAVLTMAAEPDRALHPPFHREVDRFVADTFLPQRPRRKPHHHFRAAHHHDRRWRRRELVEQLRHHSDLVMPAFVGLIRGEVNLGARRAPPFVEALAVQKIVWRPHAMQDMQFPVLVPAAKDIVDKSN